LTDGVRDEHDVFWHAGGGMRIDACDVGCRGGAEQVTPEASEAE
jgi:hypothetical protein